MGLPYTSLTFRYGLNIFWLLSQSDAVPEEISVLAGSKLASLLIEDVFESQQHAYLIKTIEDIKTGNSASVVRSVRVLQAMLVPKKDALPVDRVSANIIHVQKQHDVIGLAQHALERHMQLQRSNSSLGNSNIQHQSCVETLVKFVFTLLQTSSLQFENEFVDRFWDSLVCGTTYSVNINNIARI